MAEIVTLWLVYLGTSYTNESGCRLEVWRREARATDKTYVFDRKVKAMQVHPLGDAARWAPSELSGQRVLKDRSQHLGIAETLAEAVELRIARVQGRIELALKQHQTWVLREDALNALVTELVEKDLLEAPDDPY